MPALIKGQKMKLTPEFTQSSFSVKFNIPITTDCEIDIACFGLDNNGKLSDDRYFIFYNQLESPEGAIKITSDPSRFEIDLSALPHSISKLVFTATIDDKNSMNVLGSASLVAQSETDTISYSFCGTDFFEERAIIVAEIYKKEDLWRFSAVGNGFNGGLDALICSFGGEVDNSPEQTESPTAQQSHRKKTSTKKHKKNKDPMMIYMGFEEQIKGFAKKVQSIMNEILTEEATKTSVIMPFFQLMGFDVFNPLEFCPEYTADIGTKKGEKVDYAIILNGEPVILIEVKSIKEDLENHAPQLFRYFVASKAKFAILTNGIDYKFFTDLDKENVMDNAPFLEINLLDMNENSYQELVKFHKANLDVKEILDSASELRYINQITNVLKSDLLNPSDDFTRYILNQNIYNGRLTQNTLEKFKPLIKQAASEYINNLVNDKIQNALKNDNIFVHEDGDEDAESSNVEVTQEELSSFYIIKSLLADAISVSRISYKDTQSYFGINIDNKVTKWICRIYLRDKNSYVIIPDHEQNQKKYPINSLDDLYQLKEILLRRLFTLLP